MARPCSVCAHPQRAAVEAMLTRATMRDVEDRFGIPRSTLSRHATGHRHQAMPPRRRAAPGHDGTPSPMTGSVSAAVAVVTASPGQLPAGGPTVTQDGRLLPNVPKDQLAQQLRPVAAWDALLRTLAAWQVLLDVDARGLILRYPAHPTEGERRTLEAVVAPVAELAEQWMRSLGDRDAREAAMRAAWRRLGADVGSRTFSWAAWDAERRRALFSE